MKQTAVDWLFEKITEQGTNPYWDMRFIQAKEMEKEQMYDAYKEGFVYFPTIENFNEYYNETYEKK